MSRLVLILVLAFGTGACVTPQQTVERLSRLEESLSRTIDTWESRLAALDPDTQGALVGQLQTMIEAYKSERDMIRSELDRLEERGPDLGWVEMLLGIGLALLTGTGTYKAIELRRGTPENRKGLPPKG